MNHLARRTLRSLQRLSPCPSFLRPSLSRFSSSTTTATTTTATSSSSSPTSATAASSSSPSSPPLFDHRARHRWSKDGDLLFATARSVTKNKGYLRRLRKSKQLPASLMGGKAQPGSQPIILDDRETQAMWFSQANFRGKVFRLYLDTEEEAVPVICRDVRVEGRHFSLLSARFVRWSPGSRYPLRVPLKYVAEEDAPVVRRGGFILKMRLAVQCVWTGEGDVSQIPDCIPLDLSETKPGTVLRMDRLKLPDGLELAGELDTDVIYTAKVGRQRG